MRTCTNCGNKMVEGYLLEEMCETFCSAFCLDIAYPGSSKELSNMTEQELDDSNWYWTSWEEDDIEIDEDESSSMEVSYEDIVRVADGRPVVNKYHYEDYEDGTYFEDGE